MYFLFIFAALASPIWEEREAASAALSHLIDRHPAIYGPRLAEWARDATEPEVRSRCRVPLAGYSRWRLASYVPRTVPVWPCVDCLPMANPLVPFGLAPDIRDRAAGYPWMPCRRLVWLPEATDVGPFWGRYRTATETMVRARLLDGDSPEEMDRLLSRAWAIEQSVSGDCGEKFAVSVSWTTWRGGYPMPRSGP